MNPVLTGAAMPLWSDLDGRHGPGPVRGAAVAPLLSGLTGRVLVAGPHDPELVDGPQRTLLVRGQSDAQALAERFDVRCGGPQLAATGPWDTIVALDGLDRLGSAEDDPMPWSRTLQLLLSGLRDGGTVLLGHENLFGLHRLVAVPGEPSDSDWTPSAGWDGTRPAGLAELQATMRAAGLAILRTYAVFPALIEPSVLLDAAALDGCAQTEVLLSGAWPDGADVVLDPARLSVAAARHGLAADLAPGWIVEARLIGALQPLPEPPAQDHTLENLLLAAAAERDLPRLRQLLAQWQHGPLAAVAATRIIVAPDGSMSGQGAAGSPEVALHAFAVSVLAGPHPWPAPADAADLTLTLATMAGLRLDAAAIPADQPRADLAELRAENARLTRLLIEAREQHAALESTIAERDRALRHARIANGPLLVARAVKRRLKRR